ncbi:MAG: hypothetical protein O3B11_06765, partial [Bacteroidetes bacterium]|nr:hypothetical protein [Bacteroidota bacterium]
IYGGSSTLRYNNAYVIGTEWTMDATSGGGVPHHVSVEGSSSLDFADSTGVYTCLGNFDIVGPTSSIDLSDFLGDLKVTLDFSAGTANTATITMPTTEGKGNLVVLGDLTLGASATVSGDEGNLILAGDFTHNATSSAFGMVKFNGAGADQDLTGNVITVDSLVVANTNNTATNDQDVDLNANVDITPGGVFNPVDGTTNISGTFTMNSNASGTARIATLENSGATSNVVGNITFERYVPSTATTTWLVMGNYVTTSPAMDVQDWMDDFGGSIYVYSHDETVNANANGTNGWTYMNSTSTLSTDGIGYFSIVPSSLGTSGHTLSNSGTYTTATVSPGVSHTAGPYNQFYDPAGWNLLVNPYPTPIDGDAFVSNNGSVSEYYILQNSSGNWLSSSQVGSLEAPDAIDIGQGFYAYVASGNGGTASFTPNLACYGGNTFTRSEDTSLQGAFALNIEDESERYGGTTIKFHLEGEADFQPGLDAPYKAGASANPRIFSQLEDGTKLAVNVPFMLENSNEMIALTIQTGVDGQVSISIDESTELPAGLCARLIDTVTEEAIDVASETMSLELEPMETYENRFYLEFLSTPVFEQTVSHCEGGTIHFNGGNAQNWNITWDSGEMSGEGCATNLDPGTYELNAVNTLNGCTTSDMLEIPDVCLGDFNFNGGRDIPDLLMLLIELQPVSNLEQPILQTDCDCDGIITTSDLLMFLPYFGSTCE